MDASDLNTKNRLAILLSAGSCTAIVALSYHVINQRVMYGGFDSRTNLDSDGWTLLIITITLLSVLYFFSALFVLILDIRQSDGINRQRLLLNTLNFQGFLIFCLFIVSPESAGVFAAMCLARVRNFYALKTALFILLFTALSFTLSIAFYYGKDLGLLGVLIVTVLASAFYAFTLVHSHNAVRERELKQEALNLNRELLATRELLAQSSRQSERLRISRNIHDLMGHQLTGLILNLEVASHISEGMVQDKIKLSLSLAKSLLGDLRDAVSDLRESAALDFRQTVDTLITNIPELKIDLFMEEGLVIGNAETAETLVRCIQESLTNILRHAKATQCAISLYHSDGEIVLRITDNGSALGTISPGNGLNGMLERISALSGHLRWGNNEGSFFLEAILPLKAI